MSFSKKFASKEETLLKVQFHLFSSREILCVPPFWSILSCSIKLPLRNLFVPCLLQAASMRSCGKAAGERKFLFLCESHTKKERRRKFIWKHKEAQEKSNIEVKIWNSMSVELVELLSFVSAREQTLAHALLLRPKESAAARRLYIYLLQDEAEPQNKTYILSAGTMVRERAHRGILLPLLGIAM